MKLFTTFILSVALFFIAYGQTDIVSISGLADENLSFEERISLGKAYIDGTFPHCDLDFIAPNKPNNEYFNSKDELETANNNWLINYPHEKKLLEYYYDLANNNSLPDVFIATESDLLSIDESLDSFEKTVPLEGGEIKSISNEEIIDEHTPQMSSTKAGTAMSITFSANPVCYNSSYTVNWNYNDGDGLAGTAQWSENGSTWYSIGSGSGTYSRNYTMTANRTFYGRILGNTGTVYYGPISATVNRISGSAGSVTPSSTSVCPGSSVTISNSSNGSVTTGILQYYWYRYSYVTSSFTGLGVGGSSYTGTIPTTPGNYYYKRRAYSTTCGVTSGNYWDANSATITVKPLPTVSAGSDGTICTGSSMTLNGSVSYPGSQTMPTGYCASSSSAQDEIITNVSFNGGSQSSGFANYTDYTGSLLTTVVPGSTYTLSVTYTIGGTYTEYLRAFVDWDRNGTFETSYLIFSGSTGSATRTLSINVPSWASPGETRMRISMKYNTDVTSCETSFGFGEVEDYKISVAPTKTYSWTPTTGLSSSTIANPTASPTSTTTYTLTGSYTGGCSATDNVTVTVDPQTNAGTMSVTNTSFCVGGSTQFSASGTVGFQALEHQWNGTGGTWTNPKNS